MRRIMKGSLLIAGTALSLEGWSTVCCQLVIQGREFLSGDARYLIAALVVITLATARGWIRYPGRASPPFVALTIGFAIPAVIVPIIAFFMGDPFAPYPLN